MDLKNVEPESDFPAGLAKPAMRALAGAASLSEAEQAPCVV